MFGALAGWSAGLMIGLTAVVVMTDPFGLYDLFSSGLLPFRGYMLATLLAIPTILTQTGPLATALATTICYVRWTGNNEVVCMKAIGISVASIALPGIFCAIAASAVTATASLYLLAAAFPTLSNIVFTAKHALPFSTLAEGPMHETAPGMALSFQRRRTATIVYGVTIVDHATAGEFRVLHAVTGTFLEKPEGLFMLLEEGTMQRDKPDAEPIAFNRTFVPLRPPVDLAMRGRGYYEEHITKLFNPPASVHSDPLEWRRWNTEGHQRIVTAVLCLDYALLALGILLPGASHRAGLALRLGAIALVVGLVHGSMIVVHSAVVQAQLPVAILYLYAVVPGLVGCSMLLADRPLGALMRLPRRSFPPAKTSRR
jgi:lipopolysaccharide export system permease protein